MPDATVISYDHDAMGRRIAKRVNGTVTEKYLWQDATTLLAVLDAAGNPVQRFEYADGRMPVSMTQGGQVYYFAYDQVGSLRVVTDALGTVVKRVDYDSFGNILNDSNPSFSIPFGFAGGLHDRNTGFVRFGARDYDPATGKWCAKDPIDFFGGDSNLLNYCLGDPVNLSDPSGLSSLVFDRSSGTITLYNCSGGVIGSWAAANNPQSGASQWPNGTSDFSWLSPHSGSTPDSAYGSHGNFIFDVEGHEGLGVHSGRENVADRLGRSGPTHATDGCIRTTDEATLQIGETHSTDRLTTITVQE